MQGQDSVLTLKGVGSKTETLLGKLNIHTIYDLLYHFPNRYEYFDQPTTIQKLVEEELGVVKVRVIRYLESRQVKHLQITKCLVSDGRDELLVTFYNTPYVRQTFIRNQDYILYGSIESRNNQYTMEHPVIYNESQYEVLQGKYQPIYPLTKGVTNNLIRKLVGQVFEVGLELTEGLPHKIREQCNLVTYEQAMRDIHSCQVKESITAARNRLIFDEFFQYFYYLLRQKEERDSQMNPYVMKPVQETAQLLEALPYHLTNAQVKVWKEIMEDLESPYLMNRLVQGDVGSGKTILAYLALIMCVGNGLQGALMVPTEVLAKQHFEGLVAVLDTYGIAMKPILLTGSLTAKEKKQAREQIELGQAHIVIGTHALIQEKVMYQNLALVITDEQHRFGVRQRDTLTKKGAAPHVLAMSATPIPRTLALVLYADVSLSVLDELPCNRLPIKNCVVDTRQREKSYGFIEREIAKGRQAYVICKMIEESESETPMESVISYSKMLQKKLPSLVIGTLHGKMKPKVKEEIMEQFGRGEIQVLVSTTVIEVGINVPNATVIMIEDAGQFGLAQLHQLRGRVGRGSEQSYCILVNTSKKPSAKERLEVLNESNDGFYIARKDMQLRGSGDLGGIRQSGDMMFRLGDIMEDAKMLQLAHHFAKEVIDQRAEFTQEESEKLQCYMKNHDKIFDFGTI